MEEIESAYSIQLLPAHKPIWERLHPLFSINGMPQNLLFLGPDYVNKIQLALRLAATNFCKGAQEPCGDCSSCQSILHGVHPDVFWVGETQESGIKIDQIRELQQSIYQTPKKGEHRFLIIEPADKLNIFAANALLKILEEPPKHTVFFLLAEQTTNILPTILSRCQRYTMAVPPVENYIELGRRYPEASVRRELTESSETLMAQLFDFIEKKRSPCMLAAEWEKYPVIDLIWYLYLVTAKAIYQPLVLDKRPITSISPKCLSILLPIPVLFKQLDKINVLRKKINHNINVNPSLAIENILIGYLERS